MAPPNSVAVASAIPNSYFGQTFGAAAAFPSAFTFHGHTQPFVPSAHYDVDSTGRTLSLGDVAKPLPGVISAPGPSVPIIGGALGRYLNGIPRVQVKELPSWWAGHARDIWNRFLPNIPERGV